MKKTVYLPKAADNTLINLEELIVVLAAHKIAYEKFIESSKRYEKEGKPCIDSAT